MIWKKTKSTTAMKTPMIALIRKTSTVRLRTWIRVGQVTFFSSDQDSAM